MKNFILSVCISLIGMNAFGQIDKAKEEAIDALLLESRAKEVTEQLMQGLISSYVDKKPGAPESLKQDIFESLDFKAYLKQVKAAYDRAYSKEEIIELTKLHKSNKMEAYKQMSESVSKDLYNIGTEFGRESVKLIQEKLSDY